MLIGDIKRPLIVAPKLVSEETWPTEIKKWAHTQGLTISIIPSETKKREAALRVKADLYIIGVDNFVWLAERTYKKWPFDYIVIDESSKFKSQDSKRFYWMRKVSVHTKGILLLTGTPIPNGLLDLWPQMYILDQGKRLGKTITGYRAQYFYPIISEGHNTFKYGISEEAEKIIYSKVDDICLSMKAKDWLNVPERCDIIKEIVLDDYTEFKQFKKDAVLEIQEKQKAETLQSIATVEDSLFWTDNTEEIETYTAQLTYLRYLVTNPTVITAVNAGVLYNKLLQYANGAVYDDERKYHVVQDKKLDAIEEAINELQGKPVLIFYQFKSDIERLKKRIPGITVLKSGSQIADWNAGKISILLAHPASTGHGLNLQYGGNYIFWFGLPHSLELYLQAIARLERQGQKLTVFNVHFMVKGTPEYRVYKSLQDKTLTQDKLIDALK